MLAKTDVAKIYETVLSGPGMEDSVKLQLRLTRRNILVLNKIIERGVNIKESDDKSPSILDVISKETIDELLKVGIELLEKGGLSSMHEKLKSF